MAFYTILAMDLGALMCICHLLTPFNEFSLRNYLSVGFWILFVAAAEWGCNYLLRRQKISVGFGTFLLGATIWIIADWFIFHPAKESIGILWSSSRLSRRTCQRKNNGNSATKVNPKRKKCLKDLIIWITGKKP